MKAGVEVNNPDVGTAGATALMYAAASVSNDGVVRPVTSEERLERQVEMMSVLVEAGASLDATSNEGQFPTFCNKFGWGGIWDMAQCTPSIILLYV